MVAATLAYPDLIRGEIPSVLPRLDAPRARVRRAGVDLASPTTGPDRPIRAKIAAEVDEFEQAFRLLAVRYQARGYEEPGRGRYRFTPYHALPETTTFVAKRGDRVVATLSLVPDTDLLGLPIERIYPAEVEALRRRGRRLGEVTSLAVGNLSLGDFRQAFLALKRLMFQHHVRQGGDGWVIGVHPRHRAYYRRSLGFAPLGPRRSYPDVRDHPAEAFYVDVERMRGQAPRMYHSIFGVELPEAELAGSGRPAEYLGHFAARSTPAQRRRLIDVRRLVDRHGGLPRWRGRDGDGSPCRRAEAALCGS